MRGREEGSANLFSYVRLEERVPADHPLRPIRALTDEVLAGLRKVKLRGRARVEALFTFAAAAYNLVRLPKLMDVSEA